MADDQTLTTAAKLSAPEAGIAALIPTTQRVWKSADGRSMLARITMVDVEHGVVALSTAGGEAYTNYPLSRFSDSDQTFLRHAARGELVGRVVEVWDGDSVHVLTESNTRYKVRLQSIDAPEIGQTYGQDAKQALADLVLNRDVRVIVVGRDRYSRYLGWLVLGEMSVNHRMVEMGAAWNDVEHSNDDALVTLERTAKEEKRGLWTDQEAKPPWEWRSDQRVASAQRRSISSAPSSSTTSRAQGSSLMKVPIIGDTTRPVSTTGRYWLNTKTGKRHNSRCRNYGATNAGRSCGPNEGSACGICGG